jgi:hypothetical protein
MSPSSNPVEEEDISPFKKKTKPFPQQPNIAMGPYSKETENLNDYK